MHATVQCVIWRMTWHRRCYLVGKRGRNWSVSLSDRSGRSAAVLGESIAGGAAAGVDDVITAAQDGGQDGGGGGGRRWANAARKPGCLRSVRET